MSFKSELVERRAGPESAFLKYVNLRPRFPASLFVFVEDRDDARFYGNFLSRTQPVFLYSGGKAPVLKIFERIKDSPTLWPNTAYIVDRDLDEGVAPPNADLVLRTPDYSWECHSCTVEAVKFILFNRTNPPLTDKEWGEFEQFFTGSMSNFSSILRRHSAMTYLSAQNGGGFGLDAIPLTKGAVHGADGLVPSADVSDWLEEKLDLLSANGIGADSVLAVEEEFGVLPIHSIAHGKVLYRLVKAVLSTWLSGQDNDCCVDLASPLMFALSLPTHWGETQYVEQYLMSRGDSEG